MAKREWVKLPTAWINDGGLKSFGWKTNGSGNVAALMLLIVIAHRVDEETGLVKATYSELQDATLLSRTKISQGLQILVERDLIANVLGVRSHYRLSGHGQTPWGKLPAKKLYRDDVVQAFSRFTLRHKAELSALKLFLFLIARRDNATNLASASFKTMSSSTGILEHDIRSALDILVLNGLIHIEPLRRVNGEGYFHAYRIAHIDPFRHMGTSGRSDEIADNSFADLVHVTQTLS